VAALLEHGAAVGVENDYGRTALHAAAVAGHVEVCLALVRGASDLFARDKNECTPLCRAVVNGHKAVAVALALKGGGAAYVNLASPATDTPLSRACVLKAWDMAVTLVWACRANAACRGFEYRAACALPRGCCHLRAHASWLNATAAPGSCGAVLRHDPAALPPAPPPAPPPARARNVLHIVVDDLRPDLAPFGPAFMRTPHLAVFVTRVSEHPDRAHKPRL